MAVSGGDAQTHASTGNTKRVVADQASQLEAVCQVVCEAPYDLEEVRFHPGTETLEVPFEKAAWDEQRLERRGWLLSRWTYPVKVWILRVHHVISYKVHDEAQIGLVNLAIVEYDETAHEVRIFSNFPVVIIAEVRELKVEVEETDTIVRHKRIRLFNWCAGER